MVGPIQLGTNIHLGHLRDTTVAKLLTLKCSGSVVAVLFGKDFDTCLMMNMIFNMWQVVRSLKLAPLVCVRSYSTVATALLKARSRSGLGVAILSSNLNVPFPAC